MIQNKESTDRQYYRTLLLQKLSRASQQMPTQHLYLDTRASNIVLELLAESEIYGTGLTEVHKSESMGEIDLQKVVVVTALEFGGLHEVQRWLHLFGSVYLINLTLSGQEGKRSLQVSPLRKQLKHYLQVNLNFLPFIDCLYSASRSNQPASFVESFSSYLVSLPSFHEYQLQYSPGRKSMAQQLISLLNEKLGILQRHSCPQYKATSSPRVKVLLLDRKMDMMSPLLYSYYYGPLSQQTHLFERSLLSLRSPLYRTLFSMDFQQASEYLAELANHKAQNRKLQFQLHQFDKAKEAISTHFDEKTSPAEITLHIEALDALKTFCKRRAATTALQQSIVNGTDESGMKMRTSKVIDRIEEWSRMPLQEYKPSTEDYVKILILSYMVNSFWFFHRRILNAGLSELEEETRKAVITYCKQIEDSAKPLVEKEQGEERYDLFRHMPKFVHQSKKWMAGECEWPSMDVNKSASNRESKLVIAIDGPLGYNQAAFLMRQLSSQSKQVTIFAERFVTTKEYLELLLNRKIT